MDPTPLLSSKILLCAFLARMHLFAMQCSECERTNVETNSNIRIVMWEKIIGVNQLGSMSQRARHKNSKSEKSSVFLFVPYFSLMPENLT